MEKGVFIDMLFSFYTDMVHLKHYVYDPPSNSLNI